MAPRKPSVRFGDALRVARLALQVSQEELEPAISRRYATQLERGLKSPTVATVERLAESLKLNPGTLLLLACVLGDDKSSRRAKMLEIEREVGDLLAAYARLTNQTKRTRRQ